ncbi:NnrU family protein [Vibrio sp. 10N.286.49.C2]|uniref:NnrU family protein n=1 Tax=unclassified Vibrio TaxID=2614977 RepID=UPI000C83F264|nr:MULTISPECIES: NnrU family protein [unclassified Vibrio]PMH26447.1 NnrU family protein [Vibrio sp. 10N.286.49.C2]PMH54829.1 NnrU family protein [Vibrio sp. 10N.286.49.B1]PMH82085.1 NnrU family protein [Vibrio sp. 10N.286.48.B7]
MALLIIGLILFLGIHSISIFAQDSRDRLAAKNTLMWKGFYSIVSIVGIILIAKGYAALRFDPVILYSSPYWLRHITYLGMLFAMVLFVAPYFPGRIGRITKHPQLLAVKIWAICHLLVNGTLADVILFSSFLIWAVLDIISMKKREKRAIPSLPESGFNDVIAVIIGIALTVSFVMFLHGKLIGMPLIG